jgi:hypothetical protein
MLNVKSADLTNPFQKGVALLMVGAVLVILWFLLPPLITIFANIWILIALAVPMLFLIYSYEAFWSLFKRLSWNMTKKMISSDKLWYLWQGYNYLLGENDKMAQDLKAITASRIQSQKTLQSIASDATTASKLHELETNPTQRRVLEVKVKMLDQQFKNIEPKVLAAEQLEKDLIDYYENRVADTQILKINLDGKAQEYELYKQMAKATANASNWMKNSTEMVAFNESLKQIDASLDSYTADIEDFRRNVLPKMSSNSTERTLNAQEGAALIEQYKKSRLSIAN